jgi:hypothetical protein
MPALEAWRKAQAHRHRYTPFGNGLESCDCGSIRPVVVMDDDDDDQRPETD